MKKTICLILSILLLAVPVCASERNFSDLEQILREKNFEDSMKQKLLDAGTLLEKNYDHVYAYRKISKEQYLENFYSSIRDHLETAMLVEEQDNASEEAKFLAEKNAVGYTKDSVIYLKTETYDRTETDLLHEVEHLNNQYLNLTVGDTGIDTAYVLREGFSARAEDFGEIQEMKPMAVGRFDSDKKALLIKEFFFRENGTREYIAVYQMYENMIERLEILLGMDVLSQYIHSKDEFITSVRAKLCQEFDKENVDKFLCDFIVFTAFINHSNIAVMDNMEERINLITHNIRSNKEILRGDDEWLKVMLMQKIEAEEENIGIYQGWLDNILNSADGFGNTSEQHIRALEGNITLSERIAANLRNFMEIYTAAELRDILEFELRTDEAKLEAYTDYLQNGCNIIWNQMIALEDSMNTLLCERIKVIGTSEEFEKITQACLYYAENIMFCLTDNSQEKPNVTQDHYSETVLRTLIKKEILLKTDSSKNIQFFNSAQ